MSDEKCAGSGSPPAEMVILDTVPGIDPKGTCSICGSYLTLNWYRLPQHGRGGAQGGPAQ